MKQNKTLEFIEYDIKNNEPIKTLYSIQEVIDSAKGRLRARLEKEEGDFQMDYHHAINLINDEVKSIAEVNQACAGLINYRYIVWYEMLHRPVSIGCQPSSFFLVNHDKGEHGIVAYDRELTKDELKEYEMIAY